MIIHARDERWHVLCSPSQVWPLTDMIMTPYDEYVTCGDCGRLIFGAVFSGRFAAIFGK